MTRQEATANLRLRWHDLIAALELLNAMDAAGAVVTDEPRTSVLHPAWGVQAAVDYLRADRSRDLDCVAERFATRSDQAKYGADVYLVRYYRDSKERA